MKNALEYFAAGIARHHKNLGSVPKHGGYLKSLIKRTIQKYPDDSVSSMLDIVYLRGPNNNERKALSTPDRESFVKSIIVKVYEKFVCAYCKGPLSGKTKSFMPDNPKVTHCSSSCQARDPITIASKEATLLLRYGVTNPLKSDAIKAKMQETCIDRYGSKNPSSSSQVKSKRLATFNSRYGVSNPSKVKEFQDKKIETSLERYGTLNPNQSDIVRSKAIATCMERYGAPSTGGLPERLAKMAATVSTHTRKQIKESNAKRERTTMANHGVRNYNQSEAGYAKNRAARIDYKSVTVGGKTFNHLQGYEDKAINFLHSLGYDIEKLEAGKESIGRFEYQVNGTHRVYFPDILYDSDVYYEVKSTYTLGTDKGRTKMFQSNMAKMRAVSESGYKIRILLLVRKTWLIISSHEALRKDVISAVRAIKKNPPSEPFLRLECL